jgi:Ca-activated chloride channel homolog
VTFLHPEFLYLMLPTVFILFFFILTQKEPAAELFASRIFSRLRVKEKRLSHRQRNGLYLAVFILLIIAMAQPVIIEAKLKVKAPAHEVMAALDISASMRSDDLYPSRLAVARTKLLALISRSQTERIGVLAFGKDVYVVSPPTGDQAVLRQMIEHFEPDAYAEAGTDIMALLAAADNVMAKLPRRDLLLFTDGGDSRDFSEAGAFARAHNIRLFILGTATSQGAPLEVDGKAVLHDGRPVVTTLNPALPELAAATGGYYVQAAAGSQDVAALLSALRRGAPGGADGVKEIERYGQLYILPLAFALVLLLFATSSLSRRERVAVPPAVLLGIFLLGSGMPLKAEQFDYELLGDAKALYQKGEYRRAANAFYRYAKRNENDPKALYDSAHAFYRAGDYTAAAALWKGIRTKERLLQFRSLYNLGNAYAMLGGEGHLEAAVKAYRKALYLQNDQQTQENLEIVLGRLMRLMQAKRRSAQAAPLPGAGGKGGTPAEQAGTARSETPPAETAEARKGETKPTEATGKAKTAQMSDFEAAVWMKTLQQQTRTRLYKITPPSAKGGRDASAW